MLQAIELEIAPGSFVALVGPSGSGKSTLLRLIAGLDTPTRGKIQVQHRTQARSQGRASTAFVFQDAHLLPWRTALENVALPLELLGLDPREARRRAEAPLVDVELGDALDRYPDQLSGGMRMRVSIARALVTEPELLLLDEPFAALDELSRQRLEERLRALWKTHGMTVLFVTHSLAEAVFLAERALVFSRRPAQVVLDHRVELPVERPAHLRTELGFVQQTALLYQALERDGSLDEVRV
ncbi:MAG: ABC transporter ATP-binding protein [Myxococcota bacterium]